MPRLVGQNVNTARRMLADSGLTVGSITGQSDPLATPGIVLRTAPGAGTLVQRNSPVDLVVSSS